MSDAVGCRPWRGGRGMWSPAAWRIVGVLAVCATRVTYDHNLLHLQAQNLESVKWEMTLIQDTAGASWHAVSIADSREKALELKAKYEKLPEVSRVVEVATLAPPDQDKKLPLLADIQNSLRTLPQRHKTIAHDLPNGKQLRGELTSLVAKLPASSAPGGSDQALVGGSTADASRVA